MARRKGPSAKDEIIGSLLLASRMFVEYIGAGYGGRPNSLSCRIPDYLWQKWQKERRHKQAIKRLRQQKWLTDRTHGRSIIVHLHQDAIVAGLKAHIRKHKEKLPKGQKCLVAFDFPNGASVARNAWRHFLHGAGFVREQLSVWSTSKSIFHFVRALIHQLHIQKWVKVYLVSEENE